MWPWRPKSPPFETVNPPKIFNIIIERIIVDAVQVGMALGIGKECLSDKGANLMCFIRAFVVLESYASM